MSDDRASDEKRLTVRLSGEAKRAVETISQMTDASINDVIRRAIGTELFLLKEQRRGAKLLLKDENGTREVVLR